MSDTLLIFIKNPRLGKVKTRLARTLGEAEALRIYLHLLEKTRQAALDCKARRLLYYSEYTDAADAWALGAFEKHVQAKGDLGVRMSRAFQHAFAVGAKRVVVIGSDCPEISGELLSKAFRELDQSDFVLGPTPDGGYYLLGMNMDYPWVFKDIAWSTETVRQATLDKIAAKGLNCSLLPELSDVDTEADWQRYL